MRTTLISLLTLALLSSAPSAQAPAGKALDVYFIDVEGGQATLFVSPSGESMLVDTGWPGFEGRDADRIAAIAKQAGVKQIDYLVITHFHLDHVGGVPQLAARLPIRHFVDHGSSVEHGERPDALFQSYADVRNKGTHIEAKPGDTIPVARLNVQVLSAGGELIKAALQGAGKPNPLCAGFKPQDEDKTENARSVGTLITFGKFRIIDLGDLTWNKEHDLMCPNNPIGTVDVYLTSHHGLDQSGSALLVHALHPRVVIMNNGAKKGGTPPAWQIARNSPGLEDFWQLHYSLAGATEHNAAETFIANLGETDTGHWIKVSAQADGSFTVTNSRNGNTKTYRPRS